MVGVYWMVDPHGRSFEVFIPFSLDLPEASRVLN